MDFKFEVSQIEVSTNIWNIEKARWDRYTFSSIASPEMLVYINGVYKELASMPGPWTRTTLEKAATKWLLANLDAITISHQVME